VPPDLELWRDTASCAELNAGVTRALSLPNMNPNERGRMNNAINERLSIVLRSAELELQLRSMATEPDSIVDLALAFSFFRCIGAVRGLKIGISR